MSVGECCRKLLSEGLDLCVRARKLDAMVRTLAAEDSGISDMERYAERHNALWPDQPVHGRSATIPLWTQEQYEHDLADWERRARHHLTQGCTPEAEIIRGEKL
jgi:hypothetical protein